MLPKFPEMQFKNQSEGLLTTQKADDFVRYAATIIQID